MTELVITIKDDGYAFSHSCSCGWNSGEVDNHSTYGHAMDCASVHVWKNHQ